MKDKPKQKKPPAKQNQKQFRDPVKKTFTKIIPRKNFTGRKV